MLNLKIDDNKNRLSIKQISHKQQNPLKQSVTYDIKPFLGLESLSNYNKSMVHFGCSLDAVILKKMNDEIDMLITQSSPDNFSIRKGELFEKLNKSTANGEYSARENAFLKKPYKPLEQQEREKYNSIIRWFSYDKSFDETNNRITLVKSEKLEREFKKALDNKDDDLLNSDYSARFLVQENHQHHMEGTTGKNYPDDAYLASMITKHNDQDKELRLLHLSEFPGYEEGDFLQAGLEKLLNDEILNVKTANIVDRFVIDKAVLGKNPQLQEEIEDLGHFEEQPDGSYALSLKTDDNKPDRDAIFKMKRTIAEIFASKDHHTLHNSDHRNYLHL